MQLDVFPYLPDCSSTMMLSMCTSPASATVLVSCVEKKQIAVQVKSYRMNRLGQILRRISKVMVRINFGPSKYLALVVGLTLLYRENGSGRKPSFDADPVDIITKNSQTHCDFLKDCLFAPRAQGKAS